MQTTHQQPAPTDEGTRLAIEIADEYARSDIEMFCRFQYIKGVPWYDLTDVPIGPEAKQSVERAVRYLGLRGLPLARHPANANLVSFPRSEVAA